MRLLDRILRRRGVSTDSARRIPPAPSVTADTSKMNRELMEAQMLESRRKREENSPGR